MTVFKALQVSRSLTLASLLALIVISASASPALAVKPWWHLQSGARPSYLPPARENEEGKLVPGEGEVIATVANLGDAKTSGEVSLSDTLPAGLHAVSVTAELFEGVGPPEVEVKVQCPTSTQLQEGAPLTCGVSGSHKTFRGKQEIVPNVVVPYGEIEMRIKVEVLPSATVCEQNSIVCEVNQVSVTGGGAPSLSVSRPVTVSAQPTPFGVEEYEVTPEEEGGAPATQAGGHPFQVTGTLTMNQAASRLRIEKGGHEYEALPVALPKDLVASLPPGLIGNPTPFAQCSLARFFIEACPQQSVVGVAMVAIDEPVFNSGRATISTPIVNLEPAHGEPARFGFLPNEAAPVFLDAQVLSGEDYGVTIGSHNITQIVGFLSYKLTFWGVPGDPGHDNQRGKECLTVSHGLSAGQHDTCSPLAESDPPPLLAMPTSCPMNPGTGRPEPLYTSTEADSWVEPGNHLTIGETAPMPAMDGCNQLSFEPQVKVTPDGTEASSPTGLTVDVHVPQTSILNAGSPAASDVRDIAVALPEGVAINPASGDGLQACSESLVGFQGFRSFETNPSVSSAAFSPAPESLQPGVNFCSNAAKIGTAEVSTPLLPPGQHLKGAVYLATQNENPFGSLIALYVVVEDPISGTLVKLPGETRLTPSGQIVGIFKNNPQLAFEDAELHFFGGERAPLTTPAHCGSYTTNASFVPWSAEPWDEAAVTKTASSTFPITSGPHGSPCPGASLPFSPSLTGGTTNINAGSFSPLTTTIGREDGQQNMQSVTLHTPPGLSGLLSSVKLCPEQAANEGTCGPESEIGETIVSAGVGSDPVSVKGGRVYITEHYAGAPFGLSIVNPVKAGPFDLERDTSNPAQNPACDCVVVRARIEVDPHTAELTVTTDPSGPHAIPHLIDGIPVQIKKVNVLINRPGFTFNPTNCDPMALTGSISSDEGASSPVTVPFQATNCAVLKFTPRFAVTTTAKTSKANGASLTAKVTEPAEPQGSQANIAKVKVELPKQLPSRLTTLQKACTNAQFEANPAGCPPASDIGHAKVITPLLPVPLEGPAIFVSHGGEAFPSLTMVLQGYGVTVDLVGTTFISKAGVTSTTFKTVPDTPFSTFELTLPQGPYSALTANGNLCQQKLTMPTEFVAQNGAEIHQNAIVGVGGCPKQKALTRAQKLAAALKACHKKHNRRARAACERQARKKYGRPVKTKKRKK
jgi:uncharacterized repeat protein (TIGR01451 family)